MILSLPNYFPERLQRRLTSRHSGFGLDKQRSSKFRTNKQNQSGSTLSAAILNYPKTADGHSEKTYIFLQRFVETQISFNIPIQEVNYLSYSTVIMLIHKIICRYTMFSNSIIFFVIHMAD